MVEETIEDIEESLDKFLWIWGDLPLTLLLMTGLVSVEWSISVLLKTFTEGNKVRWLLDWIVVLKEVGKLNLFAVSPIGATIQDGGKRKRSVFGLVMYLFIIQNKIKKRKESKININSEKLNKRKEKLSVSKAFHNNSVSACLEFFQPSIIPLHQW